MQTGKGPAHWGVGPTERQARDDADRHAEERGWLVNGLRVVLTFGALGLLYWILSGLGLLGFLGDLGRWSGR